MKEMALGCVMLQKETIFASTKGQVDASADSYGDATGGDVKNDEEAVLLCGATKTGN